MKKLTMVAITLLAMIGCSEQKEEGVGVKPVYSSFSTNIYIIDVDSCQYLVTCTSTGVSTIHKQNCKYCLQRQSAK